MKLHTEFVRLPLQVDAERLAAEVAELDEALWRPHPQGLAGNTAVPLVSAGGDPDDDATKGPMLPTPALASMPYTRAVLASLGAPIGRTRLMRIDEEAEVTPHSDTNYYWWEHVRVHVPVVTTPDVVFHCDEARVHMAPGEVWAFDTWRRHRVVNPAAIRRIHLVVDTVGSAAFWQLLRGGGDSRLVDDAGEVAFEEVNHPVVMSPWEQRAHVAAIVDELRRAPGVDPAAVDVLAGAIAPVLEDWRALWALHGDRPSGWEPFATLQARFDAEVAPHAARLRLPNAIDAVEAIRQLAVRPAVNPQLVRPAAEAGRPAPVTTTTPRPRTEPPARRRRIDRPIFVVSAPGRGAPCCSRRWRARPRRGPSAARATGSSSRSPASTPVTVATTPTGCRPSTPRRRWSSACTVRSSAGSATATATGRRRGGSSAWWRRRRRTPCASRSCSRRSPTPSSSTSTGILARR